VAIIIAISVEYAKHKHYD